MATTRQCRRALDLHELELSRIDSVVGLGVVPVHEGPDGGNGHDMAVAVYVSSKPSNTDTQAGNRIPEKLEIPGRKRVVEVPTRVIETGEIVAESEAGEALC